MLDYSNSGNWTEIYDYLVKDMNKDIKLNYEYDVVFPKHQVEVEGEPKQTK